MQEPDSILLYGSFSQDAGDETSDIDCALIFKNTCAGRMRKTFQGRDFDIVFSDYKKSAHLMQKERVSGNCFMIDIFANAKIIRGSKDFDQLHGCANNLYNLGPKALSLAEIYKLVDRLSQKLSRVKVHRLSKCIYDIELESYYMMQLHQAMDSLITFFIRINNCWLFQHKTNIENLMFISPRIHTIYLSFFHEESNQNKISIAKLLTSSINQKLSEIGGEELNLLF